MRLWADFDRVKWGPAPFNASDDYTEPGRLVQQLAAARRLNLRMVLNMTGGRHELYKTDGKFDLAKWKARMDQYDSPAIKAAVAAGVADGTILLNIVIDEPNVKDWGGVVTKALIDEMGTYVKNLFPTLPVGTMVRYDWRPEERFRVIDVIVTQYAWNKGDVTAFRDGALALGRRDGIAIFFGLNVLDGGIFNFQTKACPVPLTGGPGTYVPACHMTADQIREWGMVLGSAGCGLTMFHFLEEFMTQPANLQAFKDIASQLATIPPRPCRRS
jgi:hypothetical protein